jgi:lipoate-protein ligase B
MISVVQFGTVGYAEGLRLQQKLIELRKADEIGDVLLLLEHSPVITLGRNAKAAHVLASPGALAARGVEVFECDRGGDVTFHGLGQIVGYPIFDLRGFSRQPSGISHQENPSSADAESLPSWRKTLGAVDYVRRLEDVLVRTCADFGIASKRVAGLTGVWTDAAGAELRSAGQPMAAVPTQAVPTRGRQDCRHRGAYFALRYLAWVRAEREYGFELFRFDCALRNYCEGGDLHAERIGARSGYEAGGGIALAQFWCGVREADAVG